MGSEFSTSRLRMDFDFSRRNSERSDSVSQRLDAHKDEAHMNPDIWQNLPEHILEVIMSNLPFTSLLIFCRVCKKWRSTILSSTISHCQSTRGVLIHNFAEPLRFFNAKTDRGNWDTLSTPQLDPFNSTEPGTSSGLRVLAAGGGLVCLSTEVFGYLIVWNPITNRKRHLQMPCSIQEDRRGNGVAELFQSRYKPTRMSGSMMSNMIRTGNLRVGLVSNSSTRRYKLVVATMNQGAPGTTLVYDSGVAAWKRVQDVPEGVSFRLNATSCEKVLYCMMSGLSGPTSVLPKLLKYDTELENWTMVTVPSYLGSPDSILEHRGRILLLSRAHHGSETFSVFELREADLGVGTKWVREIAEHIPTRLMRHVFGAMRKPCNILGALGDRFIQCLGQGEVLYFVGTSLERQEILDPMTPQGSWRFCRPAEHGPTLAPGYHIKTFLRVWIHDSVIGRCVKLSDWEFHGYDDHILLSFLILVPSLGSEP